ncbi:MAG TPA: UvrD-helicase domain-containing protein [Verrucomicrobiales bacterium]|nr:UvrD-helicase domain-containing protein [Verrucomicrobiales bacterium]
MNPAQREAAAQVKGPLLILAGAGTGKTRVITARIRNMVRNRGIPAAQILAITFTNKAAAEMRDRCAALLSKSEAKDLTVCTFHSLCVRILRRSIDRLGYKRNFTIYSGSEQVGLIRRILLRVAAKDEKIEPWAALSLVSRAKNASLAPEAAGETLEGDLYREYQRELKLLNAVDFDDLLLLAECLLRQQEDIREHWQGRFSYLLVDEFQDTNRLQMELLRRLAGPEHNVCVVGDDDQSIYAWRGADIANLLEFERYFPNPVIVRLEENYRCPHDVLELSNSLIRHNRLRREKRLWSRIQGEGPVRVISMPGETEEAEFVVGEILEGRFGKGRRFEDFAVLFRTNLQARPFEQVLRSRRIPYRMVGGQSFFDRREVRDLLAYFSVFLNPDDDISLLRVLNTPPRGIGAATVTEATHVSAKRGSSVWKVLTDPQFQEQLGMRGRAAVRSFVELAERYSARFAAPGCRTAETADELVRELDYTAWAQRQCRTPEEGETRRQGVTGLLESLRGSDGGGAGSLQGWLDALALEGDRDREEDVRDKSGVCLITLHAAKGLEFPYVYLAGFEEGLLPHRRAEEEGNRDEERRLLYVGLTRAQRRLTLTWRRSRTAHKNVTACLPSSFLREMDAAFYEESSWEELRKRPVTGEEAQGSIEAVRAYLDQLGASRAVS